MDADKLMKAALAMPRPACYAHMEPGEWEDGVRQMLLDLTRLAKSDGCIAAAWALSLIEAAGATVPRAVADRLAEACQAVVNCLDFVHSGGRPGEPPNPLAVIADRHIAETKVREALAEYRKAVG